MKFASVCSGIGGAEVALLPLGWSCKFTSEIEPFASKVLAHHNIAPNVGDICDYTPSRSDRAVEVLVGGTPCQSFSVAGFRRGLSDPRGGILLEYLRLAQAMRPRWLVWENVPGVLSADGGRAFGSLLGALAELGYGFAWRVLDAQYYGLAQRRKRVFLVAHLGDWRGPAAVLLEPEGVRRDPPEGDEARARIAANSRRGTTGGGKQAGGAPEVSRALSNVGGGNDPGANKGTPVIAVPDPAYSLSHHHGRMDREETRVVFRKVHRAQSKDDYESWAPAEQSNTLNLNDAGTRDTHAVLETVGVRRLTPLECERLQGFPDGWTDIEYRGKPAKDAPRYKALGNAFPVPVIHWIGARIEAVEGLM